jgi:hypothetical protein
MERLGLAWEEGSSGRIGGGKFSSISSTFLHGLALLREATKQEAIGVDTHQE